MCESLQQYQERIRAARLRERQLIAALEFAYRALTDKAAREEIAAVLHAVESTQRR